MENSINIDFSPEIEVNVLGGEKLSIEKIVIDEIVEDLMIGRITAICSTQPGRIILYDGNEYRVEDWTKDQIVERVRELYA